MLTPEEQERLAWIQCDLAKAQLLAALVDAQEWAEQFEQTDLKLAYDRGWDDGYAIGHEEGSTCD